MNKEWPGDTNSIRKFIKSGFWQFEEKCVVQKRFQIIFELMCQEFVKGLRKY